MVCLVLSRPGAEGTPAAETRLASNILDITGLSGVKANWSGSAFIDAEQKLGDAKAQLTRHLYAFCDGGLSEEAESH